MKSFLKKKVLLKDIQENNSFISVNTLSVADEEVKYTLKNNFVNELSKIFNLLNISTQEVLFC